MFKGNIATKETHLRIICQLLNTCTAYFSMYLCKLSNVNIIWNVKNLKVCYCLWRDLHFRLIWCQIWCQNLVPESPKAWTVNPLYKVHCLSFDPFMESCRLLLQGTHAQTHTHTCKLTMGVGILSHCKVGPGKINKTWHNLPEVSPKFSDFQWAQSIGKCLYQWEISCPPCPFPCNSDA